jgi:catechol 2,3-dioxygenase-like lactoylglutathione lyase family enzyme
VRALASVFFTLLLTSPAAAAPPELYREVTSVNWVVSDIDPVAAGWARLGFPLLQDFGEVAFPVRYRGEAGTAVVRVAQASFAGLQVFWFQPVSGSSAWADFLQAHGDGIMSLDYAAASRAAQDAEVTRLEGLGVGVLQTFEIDAGSGPLRVVHMDTAKAGGYAIGLTAGQVPDAPETTPPSSFAPRLSQYALVVRDLDAISAYWEKLGLPAMEVTHPGLTELRYRGQPGRFDQKLGWHRHGTVTWEWILPLAGPTVYQDFLEEHGEGFHHLGFDVPDMDAATAAWKAAGFPVVQSGAWGEKGQPGSGRFAYVDTAPIGGVTIELLWNQPAAP